MFPGFSVASAVSAREDWTAMDTINQDDVSRIRCEAIPLRLAFRTAEVEDSRIKCADGIQSFSLPKVFNDRSKPMLGYEVRPLTPNMIENSEQGA